MSVFPYEVFVRHRGYRLPYPLHRWHLPEERDDLYPPEDFKPSEFDQVNLILYRGTAEGPLTLAIEGTPLHVTLAEGETYGELAVWTPPRDEDAQGSGLWGRAGLYRVRVTHGSEAWVTTVEVQPHYLTFEQMGRMCAEIERLSTWVAYDILPYAPVAGARLPQLARAEMLEEDPAVLFSLLKERVPEALRSLRYLSSSPHLSLKPVYVATRAGVSRRQDRRSMRMEQRLSEREEGWSVQRTGELSYDIYENQFVKRLLMDMKRRLSHLQKRFMNALYELERQEDEVRRRLRRQYGDQEERIRREEPNWTRPIRNRRAGLRAQIQACGRMGDSLSAAMMTDLLREVRPLQGIVRPTNVLQHDPHYSRLWAIYRLLKLSDRGEASLAHRFHRRSRPSWELYEMWTAVQVMETCMRELRFTRLIEQSVAVAGQEEGVVYLYDTPRPATLRLAHETEPLELEIVYGGFIPMNDQAQLLYRLSQGEKAEVAEVNGGLAGDETEAETEGGESAWEGPIHSPETPIEGGEIAGDVEPTADREGEAEDATLIAAMAVDSPEMPVERGDSMEGAIQSETVAGAMEETAQASPEAETVDSEAPYYEDFIPTNLPPEDDLLATRGVQTAPDLQLRFFDAETGELLGLLVLDAKYKGGRRIWGKEGRLTNDRMALESYLKDIHRRDREEVALALPSHAADEIVLGAFALYPGERFGHDLQLEERLSRDGRLGALRVSPDGEPSEELAQVLLDAFAQVQMVLQRSEEAAAWQDEEAVNSEPEVDGPAMD